jgi:hypothetical protein
METLPGARRTGGKCPIVRLRVKIYLHHLTPASRAKNAQCVAQIIHPPVRMDPPSHHPAVYQVEIVGGKGGPGSMLTAGSDQPVPEARLPYGLLRSSTWKSKFGGMSSGTG